MRAQVAGLVRRMRVTVLRWAATMAAPPRAEAELDALADEMNRLVVRLQAIGRARGDTRVLGVAEHVAYGVCALRDAAAVGERRDRRWS
jgi:hypothetical protein